VVRRWRRKNPRNHAQNFEFKNVNKKTEKEFKVGRPKLETHLTFLLLVEREYDDRDAFEVLIY